MAIASITDDCGDACDSAISVQTCYDTIVCKGKTSGYDPVALSGSVWKADYYNRNMGSDEALYNIDAYTSPIYQNYTKIADLPIVLDSSITPSINVDTHLVEATGNGRVPWGFRPHVGDVIIGNIDGKMYLFNVTSAVPASLSAQAWWNISFTLMSEVTSSNEAYNSLIAKVDEELAFDTTYGLVSAETLTEIVDLNRYITAGQKVYSSILDKNGKLFFYQDGKKVYDPLLAEFARDLIPTQGCNGGVYVFGISRDAQGPSVIDLMDNREVGIIRSVCPKRCITPMSLAYSHTDALHLLGDADYVVGNDFSMFPDLSTEYGCGDPFPPDPDNPDKTDCSLADTPCCGCADDPLNDVNTNYSRTTQVDGVDTLLIKDPFLDDYYIFSKAFYDKDRENMSQLEQLVDDYLHNRPIDKAMLISLWLDTIHWCRHSIMYYMPFLIKLSQYSMANQTPCTQES